MSLFRSVSARLTAWHVIATAVFAVLFAVAIHLFVATALMQRTDAGLAQSARTFQHLLAAESKDEEWSAHAIGQLVEEEAREVDLEDAVAVFGADGRLLAATATPRSRWMLRLLQQPPARPDERPSLRTAEPNEKPVRIYRGPLVVGGTRCTIVLARSIESRAAVLDTLVGGLMVGIPLWIAATAALGYWLLRRTLSPVARMSAQASSLGATDLSRRLPAPDSADEFGQLAGTLNALLDRLSDALGQQRRFMAEASHELRTPVAVVRGEAEVALATHDFGAARLRESLEVVAQEAASLSGIVEDLFLLARADAGQQVLALTRFYLDELVESVVRSLCSLASRRGLVIETDLAPESMIEADEALVRRVLVNLLHNSVKYSREHGTVRVTLAADTSGFVIEVADAGHGIAPEDRVRIFDRFYRGAGPSPESGSGLGLSIARSVAELHGGALSLASSTPAGTTFRLVLPRRPTG